MSYILDALRRAEAERDRGNVPGLHAQTGGAAAPPPTGETRTGPWAVAAIAALAVAVVVLGWRPWAADAPPVVPTPVVPPIAVSPAAVPPAVVPPAAPPQAAERLVPPQPAAETKPVERPPKAPAAPAAVVNGEAKKHAAAAASSVAVAPSATASAATVLQAAELPEDVRRDLPTLAIGGASYSANPASRFVIVNGQLFHEGDTLAAGVTLEQIRLKSAVLSFKGYRYLVTF